MAKTQILIVEDDGIIAMDIESRLKQLGYGVSAIVGSGEEAIEKVKENTPDLVLMDSVLKGEMDGIEAAEIIRSRFGIPVIFLAAHADEKRLERAKLSMPFGYILKPFQNKDLRITLEMALYTTKVEAEQRRIQDELRLAYQNLKNSQFQLIQANKMVALGTLVAGVVHEINNPNNFIAINTSVVGKAWQSIIPILEEYYTANGDFHIGGLPFSTMRERMLQLLAGIADGSNRIKKIVGDLKRFAQPGMPTALEHIDVNSVVKSALVLLGNMIKNATHNFKVEYGLKIPLIDGNFLQLEQVVINLLQNACQALPEKGKGIFVSTSYDQEEQTVLIEVRDDGVGIPENCLSQVMDPFFTTKRSAGGTGLGLSVSATIVKEHHGHINVASESGQGATFTVSLPVSQKKAMLKVLVVDDEDGVRKMLTKLFEKEYKCLVKEASGGTEACIKLGTFRPDLLVLDIKMPDMDGVEVCRKIKEEPELADLKVIIITGFPDSHEAREIAKIGFTNFCPKPTALRDLRAMLDKILRG